MRKAPSQEAIGGLPAGQKAGKPQFRVIIGIKTLYCMCQKSGSKGRFAKASRGKNPCFKTQSGLAYKPNQKLEEK